MHLPIFRVSKSCENQALCLQDVDTAFHIMNFMSHLLLAQDQGHTSGEGSSALRGLSCTTKGLHMR